MSPILVSVLGGVCTAIITSILFAIVGRFRLHLKSDDDIKEIKEALTELEKGQRTIFKLLLPLLIAARDGKTNGELEEALKLYNTYMLEK